MTPPQFKENDRKEEDPAILDTIIIDVKIH
jgi:hypothetical protein